ncbi:MAG: tRNA (guanosine(46)-N7)-methyltransferase TrmB [Rhodospirillales bacterium]|nr:tRNA (guanosine(46)-N7)-methyltransferase TrmB [Rhodospirillales bacterium]
MMDIVNKKRIFGRRIGRPLNKSRADVIETLLPRLSVPEDMLKEDGSLAPSSVFDVPYQECWMEIGFGNGEHLSGLMRRHPENAYLGAEPFINGMAAFLKDIAEDILTQHPHEGGDPRLRGDSKIKVLMDDAMMLAHSLEDECLDGMYILNPDPWHKKRHHKRRIVNRENLACFHRILKPGGQLILSTDVPYLAEWIITEVMLHGGFEWQAASKRDWETKPEGWIDTAYQTKGAKGADKMVYLVFDKKQTLDDC